MNMNKKVGIFVIIILLLLIGVGIFFYVRNINSSDSSNEENQYTANKTSAESNTSNEENSPNPENTTNNETATNTTNDANATSQNPSNANPAPAPTPQIVEEQLSTFSTTIYSNDANRTTNMQITTSTLNDTVVKNGETFSFCNTIGPSSSSKGYLQADIYDRKWKQEKGIWWR